MKAPAGRLSVVIPAFNEGARIGQTLRELGEQLPGFAPDYEIRVVDDGSQDETALIVEGAARHDSRVVLQCEPHRGKGSAVRAGLLAASGDLRFMCDADLSMPIDEIARFLAIVPLECDIAIGSREGAGAQRIGEPIHRHFLGRGFNRLVDAIVLPGINDTQCGFKLFTARAVEMVFPHVTIEGWAFDVEMLFIARHRGLRVKEVPIQWHYRTRSQVSAVRDSFRMFQDVLKIRTNAMRGVYGDRIL